VDAIKDLVPVAQVITSGGAILVLTWIVRSLIEKEGTLSARWYADQEHHGRIDAEKRADRVLDMYDAALAVEEKKRKRGH